MMADKRFSRVWRMTLLAGAATLCVLLIFYRQTVMSIVEIWWRSGTYAHGFLVVPISAALIWAKREELSAEKPSPVLWLSGVIGLLGATWLVARSVQLQVVQQLCLVGVIILTVVALIGWRAARIIAFPLGFLLFAVPMGEGLLSPLMHFTADFTVKALQLTGIPVFSEGMYITLPNGRWEVAEACSGLRYLIASVTLGTLYAYVMYRGYWRRLIFVAFSIAVPIVANGIRAYTIVMIGYLSGMKLAVGVDHIIYGWVLFGIVIGVMFYVGAFWREDTIEAGAVPPIADRATAKEGLLPKASRIAAVAFGSAMLASIWPIWAMTEAAPSGGPGPIVLETPTPQGGWTIAPERWDWAPKYIRPQGSLRKFYVSGKGVVALYVEYYRNQHQGAELIDSQNVLVGEGDPVWRVASDELISVPLNGKPITIHEANIHSNKENLIVWQWYWIAGRATISDYTAKLLEAKDKLIDGRTRSASIIIASSFDIDPATARARLRRFVRDMYPSIEETIDQAGNTALTGAASDPYADKEH